MFDINSFVEVNLDRGSRVKEARLRQINGVFGCMYDILLKS